jgi:hypothetical protein
MKEDYSIGESFSWVADGDTVREILGVDEEGRLMVAKKGLTEEQAARWKRITTQTPTHEHNFVFNYEKDFMACKICGEEVDAFMFPENREEDK